MCKLRIALAAMAALVAAVIPTQAEVTLFSGEPITTTRLMLGGWGSGTAVEDSQRILVGNRSIKITTQGPHEGGCIDFPEPVELVTDSVSEADYLQFSFWLTTVAIGTNPGVMGPGFGAMMPGAGYPMGPGYMYQDVEIPARTKVSKVRIVIETADGKSIEAKQDVPISADEDGWYSISVPYKYLGITPGGSFKVSRIMIFTDVPDTFHLGQVTTVQDDSPIRASAGEEQYVAIYDLVTFQAEAEGGTAALRYEWNFGDSGPDGVDAVGDIVTHKYTKGGDFTVTLTVKDMWGMKSPVTATTNIYVSD